MERAAIRTTTESMIVLVRPVRDVDVEKLNESSRVRGVRSSAPIASESEDCTTPSILQRAGIKELEVSLA
jgi:hypothetical protein